MTDNECITEDEDFDDVEGHGFKEVAIGLGAAAAIVGGAGSAAALSSGGSGLAQIPPISTPSPSVDDPIGSADEAVDWTVASSRSARDGALHTAQAGVRAVDKQAATAVDTVVQTERSARSQVREELVKAARTARDTFNSVKPDASASADEDGVDVSVTVAGHTASAHAG